MNAALFLPYHTDQCYPQVGIATRRLAKLGVRVKFMTAQTCCAQLLANSGYPRCLAGLGV